MEMDSAVFWIVMNHKQVDALKQILVQNGIAGKT